MANLTIPDFHNRVKFNAACRSRKLADAAKP
jgi:hypothetical protein